MRSYSIRDSFGTSSLNQQLKSDLPKYQDKSNISPLKQEDLLSRYTEKLQGTTTYQLQKSASPRKRDYKETLPPQTKLVGDQPVGDQSVVDAMNSLKENQETGQKIKQMVIYIKSRMLEQKQLGNVLMGQLQMIQADLAKAIKMNEDKDAQQKDIYAMLDELDYLVKGQQISIVQGAESTLKQLRQSQNLQLTSEYQQKKIDELSEMLINQQSKIQQLRLSQSPERIPLMKEDVSTPEANPQIMQRLNTLERAKMDYENQIKEQHERIKFLESKMPATDDCYIKVDSSSQADSRRQVNEDNVEQVSNDQPDKCYPPAQMIAKKIEASEGSLIKDFFEDAKMVPLISENNENLTITVQLPEGQVVNKECVNVQLVREMVENPVLKLLIKYGEPETAQVLYALNWNVNQIAEIQVPDDRTILVTLADQESQLTKPEVPENSEPAQEQQPKEDQKKEEPEAQQ